MRSSPDRIELREPRSNRPQQVVALIEIGIHGSDPTVERVLDPTLDITTQDRFRFLIGCIGQLNAVALHLANQIDELRAGMVELSAGQ